MVFCLKVWLPSLFPSFPSFPPFLLWRLAQCVYTLELIAILNLWESLERAETHFYLPVLDAAALSDAR